LLTGRHGLFNSYEARQIANDEFLAADGRVLDAMLSESATRRELPAVCGWVIALATSRAMVSVGRTSDWPRPGSACVNREVAIRHQRFHTRLGDDRRQQGLGHIALE
jgi:hypothetical protein